MRLNFVYNKRVNSIFKLFHHLIKWIEFMQKINRLHLFFWCMVIVLLNSCSSNRLPPKQVRVFPITIGEIVPREIPLYIEAIGHVDSLQIVQIRPQVGGIIQEAYVEQGQYV